MNTDYPEIIPLMSAEMVPGRTESHAFLLWFLKNYYRLDEVEAADAVCDGPDDKGIDGIYVDDNLETIDVFQTKLVQNPSRTLGDGQLKAFTGTLGQLSSPEKVNELAESTSNTELANLLRSENVAEKIADGYSVRGIFLTNIGKDANAEAYLSFPSLRCRSSRSPANADEHCVSRQSQSDCA